MRGRLAAEWLAWLVIAGAVAWALGLEIGRLEVPADPVRTRDEAASAAWVAFLEWFAGIGILAAGRTWSALRDRAAIGAGALVVPAVAAATGIGLVLQVGYGDVLRVQDWSGPRFADGVLAGGLLGGALLWARFDLGEWIERGQNALVAVVLGVLLALALFGDGPAGSAARIRLGPIQPLELVKIAFVLFLASYLGRRAAPVRWHRDRWGWFSVPRLGLLLPAVAVLALLSLGLFWVRDLGPTLVISLVFLVVLFVVLRSLPWVGIAVGVVGAVVATFVLDPGLLGSARVETRLRMWLDPWLNGLPNGDQLAQARWAVAAGRFTGLGLGEGPAFPAGHTDLTLAHLAQELGFAGVSLYFAAMFVLLGAGLWIAAWNRTPQRVLAAAGLSWLVVGQTAVIAAGTTGFLPLTGIVVPFLSAGRSAGSAFVLVAALLAKLADHGAARADTEVLRELRGGVRAASMVAGALGALFVGVLFVQGVVLGPSTSARLVVTKLADGRVVARPDPRVARVLDQIRRGPILDRAGKELALTQGGRRVYPFGAAMGALLGPDDADVLRDPFSLERWWDAALRGYPDLADGPAVWLGPGDRALFVVASREPQPEDRLRAERLVEEGDEVRLLPLPSPDLSSVVRLLGDPAEVARVAADVGSRTVRTTLDGELQQRAALVLGRYASQRDALAAAAVVVDVDTGEVLVRAQVPDYDPGSTEWMPKLLAQDRVFTGTYGPWVEKTGPRGLQQAGSIAKVMTATVAARSGAVTTAGEGCDLRTRPTFSCTERDAQGPSFRGPGWKRPIHDLGRDDNHGQLDLVHALAVSCNVYFAQLGLDLGPAALKSIVDDGLAVGNTTFDPGEADSFKLGLTAIGQGASAFTPLQAARMAAAVGAGGVYRVCPPGHELGAPCTAVSLAEDPSALAPVLAGMAHVMTDGTGAGLPVPQGLRVYGKTGTADAIGVKAEAPYGVRPGDEGAAPHSWFVAVAEREDAEPCGAGSPGRLAVAVLLARGGSGRNGAARAALEILSAASELGYFQPEAR